MQSDKADDDDDFSRHLRIVFPSMAFENLQVEDDAELLRPIIEAMYALSLSEDNTFSMISFDTIKSDPERREYTLIANIAQSVRIFGAAWEALMTVSPTRVHRVYAEPYYDEIKGLAMMRIRVIVGSMLAPLRKTFLAYARRQRSITYSILDRVIKNSTPKEKGGNLSLEQNANDEILSQREMALEQIYKDRRKLVPEMIREWREEVRRMTQDSPSLDAPDAGISIDSQNSVISWRLPPRRSFDVEGLKVLAEKFPHLIVDSSICVKTQEVILDEKGTGESSSAPSVDVSLVIDFNFVPYHAIDIAMTDSKTFLYMNEKASAKGKNDTWLLTVDTKSPPHQPINPQSHPMEHLALPDEANVKRKKYTVPSKTRSTNKKGVGKVATSATASTFTMSTRSSNKKSEPQVITMADRVPKPSSLKRRRPDEVAVELLMSDRQKNYEREMRNDDNDGDVDEETRRGDTPPTLSSSTSTTLVFDPEDVHDVANPSSPQTKKRRIDEADKVVNVAESKPSAPSFFDLPTPDDPMDMEKEKNQDHADVSDSSDHEEEAIEDGPRSVWSRFYNNVRSTFWKF